MKCNIQACVFGLLMIAVASGSSRASSPLPDRKCQGVPATGQTDSYGSGDDGAYEKGLVANGPRFTDNLNGTVKDNLTGLIWLKDAGCLDSNWFNALPNSNTLASGGCGLTDGSVAGDWRLPNLRELQSLIDYQSFFPALPTGHPFSGVQSCYYWSSTTDAGNPVLAWYVDLGSGFVFNISKTSPLCIWPVRGGQ